MKETVSMLRLSQGDGKKVDGREDTEKRRVKVCK